ncbi:MAG TPA: hypothetical protein VL096_17595 [Pirellulaceae bacterium]|nr:hypothetical protein [Pirellulaceae bacterium]
MSDANNPYASAAPEIVEAPVVAAPADDLQTLSEEAARLRQQGRSGANWFYWIAGLSLVNTVILLAGGTTFFVCGLGLSREVNGIAILIAEEEPGIATVIKGIAFVMNLVIAGAVVGFGWISGKGYTVPFIIGMVIYACDALLFLVVGEMMSFGFHIFALWNMWNGVAAFRKLNAFERAWHEEAAIASA